MNSETRLESYWHVKLNGNRMRDLYNHLLQMTGGPSLTHVISVMDLGCFMRHYIRQMFWNWLEQYCCVRSYYIYSRESQLKTPNLSLSN